MTIHRPRLRDGTILALLVPLLSIWVLGATAAEIERLERSDPPLPASFTEAPLLAERVAAGNLPPVGERLPERPLVVDFSGKTLGEPGGKLLMLVGRNKDVRLAHATFL